MRDLFKEKKSLNCFVQPAIGDFGVEYDNLNSIEWHHCREKFAAIFTEDLSGFYFSHYYGRSTDTVCFLNKFEKILDLKQQSRFANTNKQTIVWIEPCDFWKSCTLKRSLFTIILRCSVNYILNKDNFDDALFGNYKESAYTKDTKLALMRFMYGFTEYAHEFNPTIYNANVIKHGWREEFKGMDLETVRMHLIHPSKLKNKLNIIGLESLWN